MSELIEKIEEVVGGILEDHARKPEAGPHIVAAVKSGDSVITREHLAEIKMRSAQADIPTLVAACEKLLDLLEGEPEESAEPAAEEPAPEAEPAAPEGDAAPETPAEPEAPAEPAQGA